MGKELDQLTKKMAELQARIYRVAKIDTITRAEAWVTEVSTDRGVREIRGKVKAILREANAYTKAWSERNIPKAYQMGTTITKNRLNAAGLKMGDVGVRRMNASAVNFSIEQMVGDMKAATGGISQKLDRMFRQMHVDIRTSEAIGKMVTSASLEATAGRSVAQAIVSGESHKAASEALYRAFQKDIGSGIIRIVGPSGKPRNYDLKSYTEMVGRTRTREAVVQGFKNSMIESGMDFVEVSSYGSDCDVCGPFEGNIYSLSGGGDLDNESFQGALTEEDEPPYHPNCTHGLLPYIPDADEVKSDPTGTFEVPEDNEASMAE